MKKVHEEKIEKGFLARLRMRLGDFKGNFVKKIDKLLSGSQVVDDELLDELEEILVMADIGVGTVQEVFRKLHLDVDKKDLSKPEALRARLKEIINDLLSNNLSNNQENIKKGFALPETVRPVVLLIVGVNGVGKTTSIAKLTNYLKKEGKKVMLVAADTFRAAAAEQLLQWGERLDVPVISQHSGADPSAVAFDGMEAALKNGVDVVIVDTAGRLHTKRNLMSELEKIKRVMARKIPGAPHEILLVLDATTGQNALNQAKLFSDSIDVTGIILTKLDGTARGGVIVSIASEMEIPVRFIGIGETMDDMIPFVPSDFTDALFG